MVNFILIHEDMSTVRLNAKEFPNFLLDCLKNISSSKSFTDVTLVSDEDIEFRAHKMILISSSPVFRSLLADSGDHQYVHLQGVRAAVLENLLLFMYQGEAFIDNQDINQFLAAARDFKLREFAEEKTPDSLNFEPNNSIIKEERLQSHEQSMNVSILDSETLEKILKDSEKFEEIEKTMDLINPKKEEVSPSSLVATEILQKMKEKKKKKKIKLDPVSGELIGYQFKCDICEAPYQTSVGLMFHIKAKHEGAKYPCTFCDYTSSFQPNTRRHIQEKHKGKMYQCDKCDYKIGRKELLNVHVNYEHLGVRYSCEFCSYVGKEQGKLNRHVRMVHLKLKS